MGHYGVMPDDLSSVTAAQLVDAFVHPPELVEVAWRAESTDGGVLIVSHLELWSWRVVVRGLRANRFAMTTPAAVPSVPGEVASSAYGVAELQVVSSDASGVESRLEATRWFTGWDFVDDVGTVNRCVSGGGGGSGGLLWSEFHVEFQPTPPPIAEHATLKAPDGSYIPVELGLSSPPATALDEADF